MTRVCSAGCVLALAALTSACLHADPTTKNGAVPISPPLPPPAGRVDPSLSVVLVHIDGVDPDWRAPWAAGTSWTRTSSGLAVDGRRILVGGWGLLNSRHVEVQKPGAVARAAAKVVVFDAEAGLGLLTVDDPVFWVGVHPAVLSGALPGLRPATLSHAAHEGMRVETSEGVIGGFEASGGYDFVHLKIGHVDAQRVGPSDIVSVDGQVVGLVMSWPPSTNVDAVGSPTLIDFLAEASHQPYRGYARADFVGQKLSNEVLRDELGLGPDDGGFLVSHVWPFGSSSGALEPGDAVLSVGGTKVDSDGTYAGPGATRLSFFARFSEGRHPGDTVPVQLLRHGERRTANVLLKRRLDDQAFVPWFSPTSHGYAVEGGLVFERLSHEYLATFGKDWETKSPLRLVEPYELERWASSSERPGVVVLTRVLPVAATLGYEHMGNLVVDGVNGVPVRSLDQVRAAFGHPADGFHVVTFAPGQGVRRIVLDVQEAKDADASIREKYHVEP